MKKFFRHLLGAILIVSLMIGPVIGLIWFLDGAGEQLRTGVHSSPPNTRLIILASLRIALVIALFLSIAIPGIRNKPGWYPNLISFIAKKFS